MDAKEVTRAWIKPDNIVPFGINQNVAKYNKLKRNEHTLFNKRLQAAKKQACDALQLDLFERLKKYGFLARWKHEVATDDEEDKEQNNSIVKKKRGKNQTKNSTDKKSKRAKVSDNNEVVRKKKELGHKQGSSKTNPSKNKGKFTTKSFVLNDFSTSEDDVRIISGITHIFESLD